MLLLASTLVSAGTGMMWDDGTGTYNMGWKLAMGFIALIYFVLASFIFSTVFWFTHNLLNKETKIKKK
jgi:hypothetical protein